MSEVVDVFRYLKTKVALLIAVIGLMPVVAGSGAQAAKVTVPGSPTIVMIKSKQIKAKLHHVTVTLESPSANGGAPVTSMTVQILKQKCVIRKTATSCTIKNVPASAKQRVKVMATANNKKGASKRIGVYFATASKSWLADGFTPAGKRLPVAVSKLQNTRVLSGNSTKWKKFQAINRSSVTSASVIKQAVPRVGNPTVIFNITGTVGIALPENSGQATSSGMYAVRADGTTVDSLMAGSLAATVRDFYSAPNGRFYVAFNSPTALQQGGALCALAEVNSSTGVSTCVDTTIQNVALTLFNSDSAPVQFDAQGNIYYTGLANSKFVLRKSINGVVTDIINDNISLGGFLVLTDGSVILKGTTTSSYTTWLRRLAANGGLVNLVNQGSRVTFVSKFPDGNVYFGVGSDATTIDSIRRYLTGSQTVDSQDWINRNDPWSASNARHTLPRCGTWTSSMPYICMNPSSIAKTFTTTDGRVFGLVGMGMSTNELVQLYPTPEIVNTVLKKISVVYQVGTKLVLAGTNAAGTNMLTVYEPSTYQETIIVDQTNETEVYSIAYVAQTGKILFNGLKFSNNSLVVGEVDLP